jgi:hypothetical protein
MGLRSLLVDKGGVGRDIKDKEIKEELVLYQNGENSHDSPGVSLRFCH